MRNLLIYSLLALVFVVGSASAETVILQEDFSTWPTGALTTASSLTAGWSVVENGLSVTTENATMGGKTVKSTAGSSVGCVRGTWSAVDPTTAAPFRLTLYMRMTGSRTEKGAALKSYDNLFTGCSPMLYFCPNTATNVDYRLRDRENCGGAVPSVYAVKDLYQETADKDKMIVWQILCTDVDAKLYKNGVLVKTFAGPPNGTMDNFQAVEIGVPMNVPGTTFPRGSEYGPNGTFWYDFVEVAIGPFPTPTPNLTVLPTSTPTITPTHTPGPLRIDLYGGKPIDTMLRGQNPRRGDGTRLNAVAISRNGCVRGVAGGLDADTYTWTDLTTGVDARNPNVSTLDFLREARDVNAQPLLTANVVGPGYRDATGTWFCQSPSDGWLEKLAADWVLYTNVILQNYRQGDTLPSQYQDLLDSFNWSGKEKLLSATEPLTPKV
ncbi:MAG TPA: hypothetical protein PKH07_05895, partial [bacterium]|nr:hypothetical protein [bacterium]